MSKPAEGNDDASLLAWGVIGGAAVGLAVLLFLLAREGPGRYAPASSGRPAESSSASPPR